MRYLKYTIIIVLLMGLTSCWLFQGQDVTPMMNTLNELELEIQDLIDSFTAVMQQATGIDEATKATVISKIEATDVSTDEKIRLLRETAKSIGEINWENVFDQVYTKYKGIR